MKSQRRAMFPFKEMGKVIGMPARSQVKLSRLSNAVCTVYFAKTVGITVSSVLEFNRISEDQKKDPNIQRYLKAKRDWVEKRRSDIVAGIAPPKIAIPTTEEVARTEELIRSEQQGRNVGDHDDQQSLGGAFYDDHKPQDSSVGTGASDTKYTSEVYAMHMKRQKELEMARAEREQGDSRQDDDVVDDILSAGAAEPAAPQGQAKAPGGGWKNVQSRPSGGSAWDRLRRGETAQPGSSSGYDDAAPQSAAWPRRPDMKGFGSSGPAYEAKEDSFSFTGDTNREQAKEEAQREFDERIERERNGQGADGFVGEGRWNSK